MSMNRMNGFMSLLRLGHTSQPPAQPPLGFDARVMADIRAMRPAPQAQDVMDKLLPQFTMGAMVAATVAVIYGIALLDTVPQAVAGMYASTAGFGF